MAWYVRAAERAVALPSVVVNRDYLAQCLTDISSVVEDQIRFHETTARRSKRIEGRLHIAEIVLLALTLTFCGLHLIGLWSHFLHDESLSPYLTMGCAFFPALGAALAGIAYQAEFRRVEKRSESMLENLNSIRMQLASLHNVVRTQVDVPQTQLSRRVLAVAGDTAGLFVHEVLDWRVIFLDRPPVVVC